MSFNPELGETLRQLLKSSLDSRCDAIKSIYYKKIFKHSEILIIMNRTLFVASHHLLPSQKWINVMSMWSQNFLDLSCHSMTLERGHNCERFSHLVRSH